MLNKSWRWQDSNSGPLVLNMTTVPWRLFASFVARVHFPDSAVSVLVKIFDFRRLSKIFSLGKLMWYIAFPILAGLLIASHCSTNSWVFCNKTENTRFVGICISFWGSSFWTISFCWLDCTYFAVVRVHLLYTDCVSFDLILQTLWLVPAFILSLTE